MFFEKILKDNLLFVNDFIREIIFISIYKIVFSVIWSDKGS